MTCTACGEVVETGRILMGVAVCDPCYTEWATETNRYQDDTPSLQDSDPEGWVAATNTGYWSREDGY